MRNSMFGKSHGHGGRRGFGPGRDEGREGFDPRGSGPRGFGPRGSGAGGPGFGPGGPGFGPGGPGFGPGGPGFGPGGPGFGPGGPGFGPGGHGRWHGGRGRRGRGNVRAAILALLAEEPRHGYSVMTELAARSGGLWRPSPGSIYPVLQQLQDEGLVQSVDAEGRKVFELTDAGRRYVEEHADELQEPWTVADHGPRRRVQSLMQATAALGAAVDQVARLSDDQQAAQALAVLEDARRAMYRILAGDTAASPPEPGVEPGVEPQA